MKVARRPGNPVVLAKRRHTDIPVSIYFCRSPAFLIYFYDGPLHAFSFFCYFTKDTLKHLLRGLGTIRIIYKVVFEKYTKPQKKFRSIHPSTDRPTDGPIHPSTHPSVSTDFISTWLVTKILGVGGIARARLGTARARLGTFLSKEYFHYNE